jgi:hypothetical protein
MNPYQKSATLVIRFCAAYTVATGFVMIGLGVLDRIVPQTPAPIAFSIMPFIRNGVWVIIGLFLWLYAKPLGRCLGKGLD